MGRIIFDTFWFFMKQFVIVVGLTMVSLILLVELVWFTEAEFLLFIPYVLLLFLVYVIAMTVYMFAVKKSHKQEDVPSDSDHSPLPVIAMIFTTILILNASVIVLGFETALEGNEAFYQLLLLLLVISVLVFMLFSGFLKEWWSDFEFETLFQRLIESTHKHLFRWISILFTFVVIGLTLISLMLSITMNIETGLEMQTTFIKIFGALFVLAIIARFITYRKRMLEQPVEERAGEEKG